ncbi:MAG: (d)CMP kinase [Rickettsiaceae bacterium]|nr:(d)CMP kinase [Rickettsiaceae bacterium]
MKTNILRDKISNLKIAVDGSSCTGKGSLCARLADEFNLYFYSSGVYYRKFAYLYLENESNIDQVFRLISLNPALFEELGENIVQTENIASVASDIARNLLVREFINQYNRDIFTKYPRVVMEGRDVGSVIAPDSDVKIFLQASIDARARRRFEQESHRSTGKSLEEIRVQMLTRDNQDETRKLAPLMVASDAIILDNSDEGFEEFYKIFVSAIEQKCAELPDFAFGAKPIL